MIYFFSNTQAYYFTAQMKFKYVLNLYSPPLRKNDLAYCLRRCYIMPNFCIKCANRRMIKTGYSLNSFIEAQVGA